MYGNNISLTAYNKFRIRSTDEVNNKNTTNTASLVNRRNNSTSSTPLSPIEVAYQLYSAIHKERINAKTT